MSPLLLPPLSAAMQPQQLWTQAVQHYASISSQNPLEQRLSQACRLSQADEFEEMLPGLLAQDSAFYPAWLLLGHLALRSGRAEIALAHYLRVRQLAPWANEVLLAIALAEKICGRPAAAETAYKLWLTQHEDDAAAWLRLAEVSAAQQLAFQEADCLARCLALLPDTPLLAQKLAGAWFYLGLRDGVRRHYEQVLQLTPAGRAWFNAQPEAHRQLLASQRRMLGFEYLLFLYGEPAVDDRQLFDYLESLPPAEADKPLAADLNAQPLGRLRLGYFSAELTDCSSLTLLLPLLRHHSQQVELYAYNDTPEALWTETTARCKSHFAHWRDVAHLANAEIAALIRRDRIDVLIDLGGILNPLRHGVFAQRPAPVSVTGLGFCFSAGQRAIDYAFSDERFCSPALAARYPEKVVELSSVFHWQPPREWEVGEPPCLSRGYITLGSANTLTKLNPRVLALWARLLQALPQARLQLKTPVFNDPRARACWLALFEAEGVAAERLELRGQGQTAHMPDFYPRIDIALDPFPYQGGVTSCEALWMGVPVVSLLREPWRARAGTAHILAAIGLADWIAASEEAYIARALAWAKDTEFLRDQRQRLRPRLRSSVICDGAKAAAEVESACLRLRSQAERA